MVASKEPYLLLAARLVGPVAWPHAETWGSVSDICALPKMLNPSSERQFS